MRGFKEGYYPLEQLFEVRDEKSQTLSLAMDKLPGRMTLRAHKAKQPSVSIDGARVYVDGKAIGVTPLQDVEVNPGRREMEIRADKYQSLKKYLELKN